MVKEKTLDNVKVNSISFKGSYMIKGPSEVLDEVCWYLQKKKKTADLGFDFLDLRIEKKSLSETDKLLNKVDASNIKSKENEEVIVEHLLDLISIRNGKTAPFPPLLKPDNVDLFLTEKEKILAEGKIINMVEDSLVPILKRTELKDRVGVLLENLSQMRKNLSQGKPIVNIKNSVVRKYLDYLNIPKMNTLEAEYVFNTIKQGKFDIINGRTI